MSLELPKRAITGNLTWGALIFNVRGRRRPSAAIVRAHARDTSHPADLSHWRGSVDNTILAIIFSTLSVLGSSISRRAIREEYGRVKALIHIRFMKVNSESC